MLQPVDSRATPGLQGLLLFWSTAPPALPGCQKGIVGHVLRGKEAHLRTKACRVIGPFWGPNEVIGMHPPISLQGC